MTLIASKEYNLLYTAITLSMLPSILMGTQGKLLELGVSSKCTPSIHADTQVLKVIPSKDITFRCSL